MFTNQIAIYDSTQIRTQCSMGNEQEGGGEVREEDPKRLGRGGGGELRFKAVFSLSHSRSFSLHSFSF